MNGDNRLDARREGPRDALRVDVIGVLLDIDEYGNGSETRNRTGGGDEAYCRNNKLVSGAHSGCFQRHLQGNGSVSRGDSVAARMKFGKAAFEPVYKRMITAPSF